MFNVSKFFSILLGLSMSFHLQAAPIFNLFELGIQQGKISLYDQVGEQNIQTSIDNEQGTLAMYSLKNKENSHLAYMVEIYADETAYQTHLKSPQYQAFLKASPDILTEHKKRIALTPRFLGDKKVTQTATTRTNLVFVDVKPEFNQRFSEIVTAEMAESLKAEKGVIAMYAATLKEEPHKWLFFEIYADDTAYEYHRTTPHFQAYLAQTTEMLQDKRYTEIHPTLLGNKGGLDYLSPIH